MANGNYSKMAPFIADLRKVQGMTQKDLAEQLGITDKAVSKWERGLGYPDISLLPKLSQVLGVTVGELLSGERAAPSAPEVDAMVEATLQYADTATKNVIARGARWRNVAIASFVSLLGILLLVICNSAIDRGMGWSIVSSGVTVTVWFAVMSGAFIMGKNRVASLLLCGFFAFAVMFYYSTLGQVRVRDVGAFGVFDGFRKAYIPHYTIVLIMFAVSVAVATITAFMRNKKPSGDSVFLLAAISASTVLLSFVTVPAIMDYVDVHGLGVMWQFTILIGLTVVINIVSLALLARRRIRQHAEIRHE